MLIDAGGKTVMSGFNRWKKVLPFTVAIGIVGIFACGAVRTASAFSDIRQSQAGSVLISDAPVEKISIVPGSPLCSPLGCAACGGCSATQYGQEIVPDSAVNIGQLY
jgi:hypothetical protein